MHNELERIGRRLNRPIRIALAGTLKAGKSTLVNALVGEEIAPTDATEATRIVTWCRHGPTPKVTANHRGGRRTMCRSAATVDGGLTFDFARLDPEDVVDLDVEWPATELDRHDDHRHTGHVIAVPGRLRAHATAAGPRRRCSAYRRRGFLLRTLNAADIALLMQIGELVGGSSRALGVIGVASRADEIGAGRIDAMLSAKDVAKRFTTEMDKTGICQSVVPVSGLLALTARTLRQSEFVALERLAGVDADRFAKAMLSVDRFVRADSELPVNAEDPRGAAGSVRDVRHQDRHRRAARRCGRLGGAGRRVAGTQRADRPARRHRPAVRTAFRPAQGAHRPVVPSSVRAGRTRSMRRPTSSPTSTRCWPTAMPSKNCACSANSIRARRH